MTTILKSPTFWLILLIGAIAYYFLRGSSEPLQQINQDAQRSEQIAKQSQIQIERLNARIELARVQLDSLDQLLKAAQTKTYNLQKTYYREKRSTRIKTDSVLYYLNQFKTLQKSL